MRHTIHTSARCRNAFLMGILVFVGWGLPVPAYATDNLASSIGIVTYVTNERVYLNVGAADGLQPQAILWISRRGEKVAQLEITDVSDHRATAKIRDVRMAIRPGDTLEEPLVKVHAAVPSTATSRPKPRPVDMSDEALAASWTKALGDHPPTLVKYHPKTTNEPSLTIAGRAETEYRFYSYVGSADYLLNEQRLSIWTRADNLGIEGLGLQFGGSGFGRYDAGDDAYLPNRRVYPIVRDAFLSYAPKDRLLRARFGRFLPRAPIVHTLDGAEVGLQSDRFALVLFGGFKPTERTLAPSFRTLAFGSAVRIFPTFGQVRLENEAAVHGETANGQLSRAAIGFNNRADIGKRFRVVEQAVLDFVGAKSSSEPMTDVTMSLLAIDADWRMSDKVGFDMRASYDQRPIMVDDMKTVSEEWLTHIRGKKNTRAEIGMSLFGTRNRWYRPFVYTRGDIQHGAAHNGHSGIGLSYRTPHLWRTRNALDATADYGIGTGGHVVNLDTFFDTPFSDERLHLFTGLYNTWSTSENTSLQTMRNMLYMMFTGQVASGFELYAQAQVTFDHALVRRTWPMGVWVQAQVGASYRL